MNDRPAANRKALTPAALPGSPHARLRDIGLADARWTAGFHHERFEVNRTSTIPHIGRLMHESERIKFVGNFEVAAGLVEGRFRGPKWDDGDFYKWMEAAARSLATTPDPVLAKQLDDAIDLIARVQEPDGYLHTPVIASKRSATPTPRFDNPMDFEMYNMGHLISAACVHARVTGSDRFLRVARRAADFLDTHFANPTAELARHGICPSHLMALAELSRLTAEPRYARLAARLLEMRDLVETGDDDNQDRVKFRGQRVAHGHAVRATYLYAGAADVVAETGDRSLLPTITSTWDDLVATKIAITGGCGALFDGASPDGAEDQKLITRVHQAFGRPFQLPHSTAHNETCAAIGCLLWSWRLLLLTGEAKYAELVEHTLINSVLAGVSLDGTRFFYTNTLRQLQPMPVPLRWVRSRQPFFSCFCCPPNVGRIVAGSAALAYAQRDDGVACVVYGAGTLDTTLADGTRVALRQQTDYPWDGRVVFTIDSPATFTLSLRIPSWADGATVRVNDDPPAPAQPGTFHDIRRAFRAGDRVTLDLPMSPRLVAADPYVEEALNQVAIQRGPVVYCLESPDLPAGVRVLDVSVPRGLSLEPTRAGDGLAGVLALRGTIRASRRVHPASPLYRTLSQERSRTIEATFIPYFAWDNRGESEMSVWLPLCD